MLVEVTSGNEGIANAVKPRFKGKEGNFKQLLYNGLFR